MEPRAEVAGEVAEVDVDTVAEVAAGDGTVVDTMIDVEVTMTGVEGTMMGMEEAGEVDVSTGMREEEEEITMMMGMEVEDVLTVVGRGLRGIVVQEGPEAMNGKLCRLC